MKTNLSLSLLLVSASVLFACSPTSSSTVKPTPKKTATDNQTPKTGTTPKTGNGKDDPADPEGTGETVGEPMAGEVGEPTPGEVGEPVPGEPDDATVNLAGGIDPTNAFIRFGEVTGWAANKDDLKTYLMVNIYFDGDNKTGKKVGSVKANLVGSDENNGGEHAFIFYVPKEEIDSKPRKVSGYAVINNKEVPLSTKMPYALTFYKAKGGEAQTMYNSIGFDGTCKQCHNFNYQERWEKMAQDGFSGQPWSESTNYLYEKVTTNHRTINGGKPCDFIKCDNIKAWWRLEFK